QGFAFVPLDIGIETGIFRRHGLEIEASGFGGAGKIHQAMAAHSIEVALGAGTDFAFLAQGAPEIGIAQMAGPPYDIGVNLPANSPVQSAADLKGKKIGVSTAGSLTLWLALELA